MSGHVILKVLRVRPTQAQVVMDILKHGIKAEAKRREQVCGPDTNDFTVRVQLVCQCV